MAEPLTPETLADVVAMLARCPAFTGVGEPELERLAEPARIAYLAEGQDVPTQAAAAPLLLARGALLVRDARDRTVDLVGPGEFSAPAARRTAIEGCLVVVLPDGATDLAWSASPSALRAAVAPGAEVVDLSTAPVSAVMRRGLVTVDAGESCRVAAGRMREHGVSAVVVVGGPETAILTDRDLRNRLVAEGRSPEQPAAAVATAPVRTIDAAASQFEALLEILGAGVHHLPVTDRGRLVGMLSAGDLLRRQRSDPLHLRALLDRAGTPDALRAAVAGLRDMVADLLAAGTSAGAIARILAAVTDRVHRRLLQAAVAPLGPAPASYGWLAFGSQGRREQTLLTDQDTGLLLPDDVDPSRGWFAELGAFMTAELEACGYPRCAGGVMAEAEPWRHGIAGWRARFADWLEEPRGSALLGVSIAFDLRTVAGELDARDLLGPVIRQAAARPLFLGHLAREAVRHRPPIGFLGRLVVDRAGEHAGTFDVKSAALLPIVDLARLFDLAAGRLQLGTDERLAAAGDEGDLSPGLVDTLRAGFELALRVRLEVQARDLRDGAPPGNRVDPHDLPPLVRSQLREVFRAVRVAQDAVVQRYHLRELGG